MGAIYLSDNASSTTRTKHIDTHYHFIKDYIEDGTVKINFVKSENNDADLFTKNLGNNNFEKHTMKFLKDCEEQVIERQQNKEAVDMMFYRHLLFVTYTQIYVSKTGRERRTDKTDRGSDRIRVVMPKQDIFGEYEEYCGTKVK